MIVYTFVNIIIFYECKAIYIDSWYDIILILNQHIKVSLILVDDTTMDHLENWIQNHWSSNDFSRVNLACNQDWWLIMKMLAQLFMKSCTSLWILILRVLLSKTMLYEIITSIYCHQLNVSSLVWFADRTNLNEFREFFL